jgi:hypothetical protein
MNGEWCTYRMNLETRDDAQILFDATAIGTFVRGVIRLPANFHPSAPNFQATRPRQTLVMTKALAEKALEQTRNWFWRLVPGEHDFRSSTLAGWRAFRARVSPSAISRR